MYGLSRKLFGSPENPDVLCLHGFMGSAADWQNLATVIGDRAYCIALDLPGHGGSLDLDLEAYTMEGAARAVVLTLDELEVRRPVIVGYSMGGRLALYLALRYPERCAGLFLESASPGLESAGERAARTEADEAKAKRLESGDFDNFLRDWYRQPLFAPLAREEGLLRRTIEARRRNDPSELARSLRGMGAGSQPSLWADLQRLAVPTLAIAGELDGKYGGISSRMATISAKVEPVAVPGVGHNVHDEAPARYAALLGRFLDVVGIEDADAEGAPPLKRQGSAKNQELTAESSPLLYNPPHDYDNLGTSRRVRGHQVREGGRDREDHHKPPGGAQRLPPPDGDGDAKGPGGRPRGQRDGGHHPYRRRA